MQGGTDRIEDIIKSLRLFSRLDEAAVKAVDLHEGIYSTLVILGNRLKANGSHAAIEVVKHYWELPLVECYAGQLNQVFMNILGNAIDALEPQRVNLPQAAATPPSPSRLSLWQRGRSKFVLPIMAPVCLKMCSPGCSIPFSPLSRWVRAWGYRSAIKSLLRPTRARCGLRRAKRRRTGAQPLSSCCPQL